MPVVRNGRFKNHQIHVTETQGLYSYILCFIFYSYYGKVRALSNMLVVRNGRFKSHQILVTETGFIQLYFMFYILQLLWQG